MDDKLITFYKKPTNGRMFMDCQDTLNFLMHQGQYDLSRQLRRKMMDAEIKINAALIARKEEGDQGSTWTVGTGIPVIEPKSWWRRMLGL